MEKSQRKLGIIGCGAIGTEIAAAIDKGSIDIALHGCYDISKEQTDKFSAKLKNVKPVFMELEALVKNCDLILECSKKDAVREIFEVILKNNRDTIFLSVGGILESMDLVEEAKKKKINIYIPSGAVVGIDGLSAAKCQGLKKVTLTTRKPPLAFKGVKYLVEKNINPEEIKVETVLFEGNAFEAVKAFPANINVAATLSIAGIGPEKTVIKIIADPNTTANRHEINAEGDFGSFRAITENVPSPNNPKTSYLTALSTIALIKKIVEPIHIGT